MELDVRLDAFEGPLDLLLHLIEKNKIDIYDIPIAQITEQYLEYIREIPAEDMERASAFVVMAATLIAIKSKMMLPPETDDEGQEADPREELVQQLMEYKLYRYAAEELRSYQKDASQTYYREPDIPDEVLSFRPAPDADAYCAGVGLSDLKNTFNRLMKLQIDRIDEQHAAFGKIEKETVTLPEKMEILHSYAVSHRKFSFRTLLKSAENRMDVIVTFVVLLEMIRQGDVTVRQDGLSDDIEISSRIAEGAAQ